MSVNKKYRLLTDIPIGTEMVIKDTVKSVWLDEIRYFPTRYKCSDGNYYYTHQVDVLWGKVKEIPLDTSTPNPYGDDDFATPTDDDDIRDESNWNLDTGGEG